MVFSFIHIVQISIKYHISRYMYSSFTNITAANSVYFVYTVIIMVLY